MARWEWGGRAGSGSYPTRGNPSFSLCLEGNNWLCYAEALEYRVTAFPLGPGRSEVHAAKRISTSCWEFLAPKGSQLLVTTEWLKICISRLKVFQLRCMKWLMNPSWHPHPPPPPCTNWGTWKGSLVRPRRLQWAISFPSPSLFFLN